MNLIENKLISQCKKDLDFKPYQPWPQSLPPYSFEGRLLCDFQKADGHCVELTGPFADVFYAIHKDISVSELARFFKKLNDKNIERCILEKWGVRDIESGLCVLNLITQFSQKLQFWFYEKKLSLNELRFLGSLKDVSQDHFVFFDFICNLKASKSQGLEIFELTMDLLLTQSDLSAIKPTSTAETLIAELKKLRFPTSTLKDSSQEAKLKTLSWPAHTQAKWVRQGDRAGVEVKFSLYSENDFEKIIRGLERVHTESRGGLWIKN